MDNYEDYDDETEEAVKAFEQCLDSGIQRYFDIDEMEIVIDYYLDYENIEMLEKAVVYAEKLFPDAPSIRLRRSHLLCAQNQYDRAQNILNDLLRQDPGNCDVNYALGTVYSAKGQPMKALQYYMAATSDRFGLGLIYGNMADEYHVLGKTDETLRYYKLSLRHDPDDSRSINNLMLCYVEVEKPDEGITYFSNFVKQHPYSHHAWVALGQLYMYEEKYDDAIDAYEYALAINKNCYEAYVGMAECYNEKGQVGEAATALLDSVECAPDKASVYYLLGQVYYNAKNCKTAAIYFKKTIDEDQCFTDAYRYLARCYAEDGDNGTALYYIERALRFAPQSVDLYYDSALINYDMGNINESENCFQKILDIDNSQDIYWTDYATFLYHQKRYDDALQLLYSGLSSAEQPQNFNIIICACYFMSGRMNLFSSSVITNREECDNFDQMLREYCPECSEFLEMM